VGAKGDAPRPPPCGAWPQESEGEGGGCCLRCSGVPEAERQKGRESCNKPGGDRESDSEVSVLRSEPPRVFDSMGQGTRTHD